MPLPNKSLLVNFLVNTVSCLMRGLLPRNMRLFFHSIYSLTMVMNNNNNNSNNNDNDNSMISTKKLKILCLHGRQQSAAMMSNKIAGARKKLQRVYELDFLDAPFEIEQVVGTTTTICSTTTTTKSATTSSDDQQQSQQQQQQQQRQQQRQLEWWTSSNHDTNSNSMKEAYEYVIESTKDKNYDAIIGFSQGGLLGTAMVSLGYFPTVRAVVTAGSPYRTEPFDIIKLMEEQQKEQEEEEGNNVPKLHFAGETDSMVPIESTKLLCEHGGNGRIIIHEKGHLFPTKAAYVNEMLDFLKLSLESADSK